MTPSFQTSKTALTRDSYYSTVDIFQKHNKKVWEKTNSEKSSLSSKNEYQITALPTFTYDYGTLISSPRYFPADDGTIYEINIYSYSAIYYGEDQPWSIDTIRVHLYTRVERFYRFSPGGPLYPGPWNEWEDDNTQTNSYFASLRVYFYGFIPRGDNFVLIYDKWKATGIHTYIDYRFNIKEQFLSPTTAWVPNNP